jgi:hypothetical protein
MLVLFFQSYLIFTHLYIYHLFFIFCVPEYLTNMYLLHADVGPVRPTDFTRTRQRPRPEAGPSAAGGPPAGEANIIFR